MPGMIGHPIVNNDPLDNGGTFDLIGGAVNDEQRSENFTHEKILLCALKYLGLSKSGEIHITDIDRINEISRRKQKCAELWDDASIKAQLVIFGANPNTSPQKILSFIKDEHGNIITLEDKDKNYSITSRNFGDFEQFLDTINEQFSGHHYRILLINESTRKKNKRLEVTETICALANHFKPRNIDSHPVTIMEQVFFHHKPTLD